MIKYLDKHIVIRAIPGCIIPDTALRIGRVIHMGIDAYDFLIEQEQLNMYIDTNLDILIKNDIDLFGKTLKLMTLNDIIFKHKNKTGLIIGTGPSLSQDLKQIIQLGKNKKKYITISCNNYNQHISTLDADYRVVSNKNLPIKSKYRMYNKTNAKLIYADSCDWEVPKRKVEQLLKNPYIVFDQRHFNNENCNARQSPNCCKARKINTITIQEYLQNLSGYHIHYSTGNTVALHMLTMAILFGCNPIYITGIDLDKKKGYMNTEFKVKGAFKIDEILNDFDIINKSAELMGRKYTQCIPMYY